MGFKILTTGISTRMVLEPKWHVFAHALDEHNHSLVNDVSTPEPAKLDRHIYMYILIYIYTCIYIHIYIYEDIISTIN